VALLVGMAGRSHWSVSVEPETAANTLLFDVACRVQQPPIWLGSSYQWQSPVSVVADSGAAKIHIPGRTGRLQTLPTDDLPAASIRVANRGCTIQPSESPGQLPHTSRWRYRIEVDERST
jgi:hypothetical protein